MAVSRLLFNTQTLAILNMLNPNETISYDWSIDEDYSIVLLEGSINLQDNTVLTGVTEHRVQPNIMLSATGLGSTRSYFISLFRIDDDRRRHHTHIDQRPDQQTKHLAVDINSITHFIIQHKWLT